MNLEIEAPSHTENYSAEIPDALESNPAFAEEWKMAGRHPMSRELIKFIERNATIFIKLNARDYRITDKFSTSQEHIIEYVSGALVIEGTVSPTHSHHVFTTIACCLVSKKYFTNGGNRFLPKLFLAHNAIRKSGLWAVWGLVKDEFNDSAENEE